MFFSSKRDVAMVSIQKNNSRRGAEKTNVCRYVARMKRSAIRGLFLGKPPGLRCA